LVSNFIAPAFFEPAGRKAEKCDFRGVLTAPLSFAKRGYLSVFPANPTTAGRMQKLGADGMKGKRLASKGDFRGGVFKVPPGQQQ